MECLSAITGIPSLTAETVVGDLEDARDFKAFQAAVISDYAPHSAAEHELVLRLASLLWRLRRATAIETGLFDIQAGILNGNNSSGVEESKPISDLYRLLGLVAPTAPNSAGDAPTVGKKDPRHIARCYLSLAKLPNEIFERVGYYEARLWRQTLQTLVTLEAMRGSYPKFKPKVMSDAGAHRNIFGERASTRLW